MTLSLWLKPRFTTYMVGHPRLLERKSSAPSEQSCSVGSTRVKIEISMFKGNKLLPYLIAKCPTSNLFANFELMTSLINGPTKHCFALSGCG